MKGLKWVQPHFQTPISNLEMTLQTIFLQNHTPDLLFCRSYLHAHTLQRHKGVLVRCVS